MAKRNIHRERRTFNDEIKQQVLELIRSGEKSVSEICKELYLTDSAVRNWIKKDQESNGTMTQIPLLKQINKNYNDSVLRINS